MNIDVVLGLQWGDEGKGKIVDFLAETIYTKKSQIRINLELLQISCLIIT